MWAVSRFVYDLIWFKRGIRNNNNNNNNNMLNNVVNGEHNSRLFYEKLPERASNVRTRFTWYGHTQLTKEIKGRLNN